MSDTEWLHKFINCVPFGADAPQEDIDKAHRIVTELTDEAERLRTALNAYPDSDLVSLAETLRVRNEALEAENEKLRGLIGQWQPVVDDFQRLVDETPAAIASTLERIDEVTEYAEGLLKENETLRRELEAR